MEKGEVMRSQKEARMRQCARARLRLFATSKSWDAEDNHRSRERRDGVSDSESGQGNFFDLEGMR